MVYEQVRRSLNVESSIGRALVRGYEIGNDLRPTSEVEVVFMNHTVELTRSLRYEYDPIKEANESATGGNVRLRLQNREEKRNCRFNDFRKTSSSLSLCDPLLKVGLERDVDRQTVEVNRRCFVLQLNVINVY